MDKVISEFERLKSLSNDIIKEIILAMILHTVCAVQQKLNIDAIVLSPGELISITKHECLSDIHAHCAALISRMCDHVRECLCKSSHHIVEQALGYIALHYKEKFSIEDVARFAGYSPNYFSHLFSKNMKKSFSRVLSEYRIEQAKKLLTKHNIRVSEVAELVGFKDPMYFSQIFNKHTGMSPKEFQKNTTGEC